MPTPSPTHDRRPHGADRATPSSAAAPRSDAREPAPRPEPALDVDAEAVVADYFASLGAPGLRGIGAAVRHPLRTTTMLTALGRLPVLHVRPSAVDEGPIVRAGLLREQRLVRAVVRGLTAVLPLPEQPGEYQQGPGKSKSTLRNRIKRSEKMGITWRVIEADQERRELVEVANTFERANPRTEYRHEHADNADLLDVDLWLLASGPDGTPLLLAVLAIDGEWAVMRYFRTVTHSDEATMSRWLMANVTAEALVARGVRYLADSSSPITLENGLRHYQRMIGFRLHRVQVDR